MPRRKASYYEVSIRNGCFLCDIYNAKVRRDAIRQARSVSDSYASGIPERDLIAEPVFESE